MDSSEDDGFIETELMDVSNLEGDLLQHAGYARESNSLRNFLQRQAIGRKRRNAVKQKTQLRRETKDTNKNTERRWNMSTFVNDKHDVRTRIPHVLEKKKNKRERLRSLTAGRNIKKLNMSTVRVDPSFRPSIKAALKGFKSRFSSRLKDSNPSHRVLGEIDSEFHEALKDEEISAPKRTYDSLEDYEKDAMTKHLHRIRSATKRRQACREAMTLRSSTPQKKKSSKKTQRRRSRRRESKRQPQWNGSTLLDEDRTALTKGVLDPDLGDRFDHKPMSYTASTARSVKDVTDSNIDEIRDQVQSVLTQLDLSPPDLPGIHHEDYAEIESDAFTRNRADYIKRKMKMKAEDVGDIVNEIVKTEEKKDRRAQRLEAEGKSYSNMLEHKSLRDIPDAESLFGYERKISSLRSAEVTKQELEKPLSHSFRDSAILRDRGDEIKKEYEVSYEYMGKTWRDRIQAHEEEQRLRKAELSSHARMGLSEAAKIAVKKERKRQTKQTDFEKKRHDSDEVLRVQSRQGRYEQFTVAREMSRRHTIQGKHIPVSGHRDRLLKICKSNIVNEMTGADGSIDMEFLRNQLYTYEIKSTVPSPQNEKQKFDALIDTLARCMADAYTEDEHKRNLGVHDLNYSG